MKIRTKVLLGAGVGALLSVVGTSFLIGTIAYNASSVSLEDAARNSLVSVRNAKKSEVESYFGTIRGQLSTYSANRMVINAMQDFDSAFQQVPAEVDDKVIGGLEDYYVNQFGQQYNDKNPNVNIQPQTLMSRLNERTLALQSLYISENPNPLGEKDNLDRADDTSLYSATHGKYHRYIRQFLQTFGYYDIFLVNLDGYIVYSVFKELDYATNLINGPYSNSGIGRAFHAGNTLGDRNDVAIDDFQKYLPSYDDAAAFFSSPIFEGDKKVGVLIMQAPIDRLNAVMTSNESWTDVGLGESGETYIVGDDGLLRNDSRFLIEDKVSYLEALRTVGEPNIERITAKSTSIGLQSVSTPGTKASLAGQEGFDIFPDYRNVPVLSAYTPLNIPGLNWVLLAEIDEAEAFATAISIRNSIIQNSILVGLGILIIVAVGAVFLIRSITNPLSKLQQTIASVTEGDLSVRAELKSGDELEELGNAFDNMLEDKLNTMATAEKDNEQLNDSVIDLMDAASRLADRDLSIAIPVAEDVTGPVGDALNMMREETGRVLGQIRDIAEQVEEASNTVKSQSDTVTNAATGEQETIKSTIERLGAVNTSMQNVADLAETCNKLATDAMKSTQEAAQTVSENVIGMGNVRETISETEKRIKRLGERSQEIGSIVNIINTIAERTHVLALNASMQAAAAGEAGKGFAVVADEVQRLAESSRESTQQISGLVGNIQTETAEAMTTMNNTINLVVEGTNLAEHAGKQMSQTEQQVGELAESVEGIAARSIEQAEATRALQEQAGLIQESTETTERELREQSVQTDSLVDYSAQLREAVRAFKLSA